MISYVRTKNGLARIALLIMTAASLEVMAADKAKSTQDWEARSGEAGSQVTHTPHKGSLMTNTSYALFNVTSGKYITHTDSFHDTKLQWDNSHKPRTLPRPRFEFWGSPKDKTPVPVKYGDAVWIVMPGTTLYEGKPAPTFLMYREQEKGINLALSRGGSAQWEIHGGPTGTPVPVNAKIALFNKVTKDYVIYAERDHGINLRWNGDVNKPRDHRKK